MRNISKLNLLPHHPPPASKAGPCSGRSAADVREDLKQLLHCDGHGVLQTKKTALSGFGTAVSLQEDITFSAVRPVASSDPWVHAKSPRSTQGHLHAAERRHRGVSSAPSATSGRGRSCPCTRLDGQQGAQCRAQARLLVSKP